MKTPKTKSRKPILPVGLAKFAGTRIARLRTASGRRPYTAVEEDIPSLNKHLLISKKMIRLTAIGLLIFSVSMLSGCGERHGTAVIVAGSTSVQPYAEKLAEEYAVLFPENAVDVQGGGSSFGITAAETGVADIGMSSRDLTEKEQELWSKEIAKDGLAIIIHPDNPVQELSLQQVRDIYTAKISSWSELGGLESNIHVVAREDGSGTRNAFDSLVMNNILITSKAIIQNSNGAIRQLVSRDPDSIGFISLGLVDQSVKALQLDGAAATWENIMNGYYSLYRSFLFITASEPVGNVKHFIDFVLSDEGQKLLIDEGLIPMTE